jgi:hypothetical protein
VCEISFLGLGRARSGGAIDSWRPDSRVLTQSSDEDSQTQASFQSSDENSQPSVAVQGDRTLSVLDIVAILLNFDLVEHRPVAGRRRVANHSFGKCLRAPQVTPDVLSDSEEELTLMSIPDGNVIPTFLTLAAEETEPFEPKTLQQAKNDACWLEWEKAMLDEVNSLNQNKPIDSCNG